MDTKDAYRPSLLKCLWGQHPSPVAQCDETPEYRRRNRRYSVDVIVVTVIGVVLVVIVSAVAGWLWPL